MSVPSTDPKPAKASATPPKTGLKTASKGAPPKETPSGDKQSKAASSRPFSTFERLVAWRYLRSRRKEAFISVIAGFSFIGIMLGAVVSSISTFFALQTDMLQSLGVWFAGSFTDIFRGQIVDVTSSVYTVQLTGTSDKLDSFIQAVGTASILETVRSGVTGIARGDKVLSI